jgi:hypothetical protein
LIIARRMISLASLRFKDPVPRHTDYYIIFLSGQDKNCQF